MRQHFQLMEKWVWVARTKTEAHYSLEYSRGSNILKKYWKKFSGILVSDGYAPYRIIFFENIRQRCTEHLQREAKHLAIRKLKSKLSIILYGKFSKILHDARLYTAQKHSETQRIRHVNHQLKQVDDIISKYFTGDAEMIKFAKKLGD